MAKEIERKYLIRRPSMALLKKLGAEMKIHITQTYLTPKDGWERRIRENLTQSELYFTYTEKSAINDMTREENEKKIEPLEYYQLMKEKDPECMTIKKVRYVFEYRKHVFEIDFYNCDPKHAIMEVELNDEKEQVILPPVEYIHNVTGNKNYSNYAIAKNKTIPLS